MHTMLRSLLLGACLTAAAAGTAVAQSGFALKGHLIYNRATVEEADATRRVPAATGFGIGAEYVLPLGVGIGIASYTGGRLSEFDRSANTAAVLGEVNWFLRLPVIPVAPYAGVHAGLGSYTRDDLHDPESPRVRDSLRQYGYQFGVRVRGLPLVALDAQYRWVSTSLDAAQDSRFSREQVLVGVTVF